MVLPLPGHSLSESQALAFPPLAFALSGPCLGFLPRYSLPLAAFYVAVTPGLPLGMDELSVAGTPLPPPNSEAMCSGIFLCL